MSIIVFRRVQCWAQYNCFCCTYSSALVELVCIVFWFADSCTFEMCSPRFQWYHIVHSNDSMPDKNLHRYPDGLTT